MIGLLGASFFLASKAAIWLLRPLSNVMRWPRISAVLFFVSVFVVVFVFVFLQASKVAIWPLTDEVIGQRHAMALD